jgi:hypothetical protein
MTQIAMPLPLVMSVIILEQPMLRVVCIFILIIEYQKRSIRETLWHQYKYCHYIVMLINTRISKISVLFFTVTPACANDAECDAINPGDVCTNPGAVDAACGMYIYSDNRMPENKS